MAKNSVSEWSTVSSGNGDIAGLTLGLDMPPSYVNNSIQEMMAQIKQWKDGYTDPLTGLPVYQSLTVENIDIEGIANFKGSLTLNGTAGVSGQFMVSKGASTSPVWENLTLGTMADQNNTNVNIDGGTITGTTINGHTVGSNSTGNKFVSTGNPSGGADGDIWYKI